jgi:hypothetical protein
MKHPVELYLIFFKINSSAPGVISTVDGWNFSFQCIVGLEKPEDGCFRMLISMLIFVQY